jgi:hypothetical protein
MAPEGLPEPLRVALAAASILDRLRIPYITAGSFASSVHGEPRSTDDIDMVADLRPVHLAPFTAALAGAWYVSEEAARDAIARGTSFNAIHLATGVKVDVFVVGTDAFDAHRVARGEAVRVGSEPSALLRVDTPEGTVIRKLEGFRRGGERSDRPWRDVVGVLRVQGARLDRTELLGWAAQLRVSDLLARAFAEAGLPPP